MQNSLSSADAIIIGAGAAGLMCAIEAGKRGKRILVLEHQERVGKKIRISGGGRCNFTNTDAQHDDFLSRNPHFCKSALARYTPQDFIALVEKHHIRYHEKKFGQLFCDGSAQEIIDMLLRECADACVEIALNTEVRSVESPSPSDAKRFLLNTNQGFITSDNLVVATGGLSIPAIGASGIGYRIAEQFGLRIAEPQPALVPFLWNSSDEKTFSTLAGISMDVIASCNGKSFREGMLFTHRGISGPAILQISSYWNPGDSITIDLLPEIQFQQEMNEHRSTSMTLGAFLSRYLPLRFVEKFWEHAILPAMMDMKQHSPASVIQRTTIPLQQISNKDLERIEEALHRWQIDPGGTEGYEKAEVTRGGVDTNELSSRTMEAKKIQGMYFIGEVVDVTGHLGGFNFQWAWSSGWAAGQAL